MAEFTGATFTDARLETINLQRARSLHLIDTAVTDEGIGRALLRATRLAELYVSSDIITDYAFSRIPKTTNLQELFLDCRLLTDHVFRYLSPLPLLSQLHVRHCAITSEALLCLTDAPLDRLWAVGLDGTMIDDDALKYVSRLPFVTAFSCCNTHVRGHTLPYVATIDRLDLYMQGCSLTDAAFLGCPSLDVKTLDVRDTHITDVAIQAIATYPKLNQLRISGTAVTAKGVSMLNGHPMLAELWLKDTSVTPEVCSALYRQNGRPIRVYWHQ